MKLSDLATVIRSKNAGPFELTFDVLFANHDDFERVVRSKVLSAEAFAAYFVFVSDVIAVVEFEPALPSVTSADSSLVHLARLTCWTQQHARC